MQPKSFTVTGSAGGASVSPVFVVDTYNVPCNIGIGVVVSGTVVYDVQHTFADPRTVNLNIPSNATWLNNDVLVSATTTDDTNYAYPPSGIRLSLRAASSGQATISIIQAGAQ